MSQFLNKRIPALAAIMYVVLVFILVLQAQWVLGIPALLFMAFVLLVIGVIIANSPLIIRHIEAKPEQLGWTRMVVCMAALAFLLHEDMVSTHWLTDKIWQGNDNHSFMYWLYKIPLLPIAELRNSYIGLLALKIVTALSLLAAMLGFKTRFTLPLATILYLIVGGLHREYTHNFHTGLLPFYLLTILCFTPCADGLSVDKWLKNKKDKEGEATPLLTNSTATNSYSYAVFACWLFWALAYFFFGMSKFYQAGLDWWTASNLKWISINDSLTLMAYDFNIAPKLVNMPDTFFTLLGIGGVYGEAIMILVIFSAFARKILPLVIVGLHLGIWLLQEIMFIDALILPAMFISFPYMATKFGWINSKEKEEQQTITTTTVLEKSEPVVSKKGFLLIKGIIVFIPLMMLVTWYGKIEYYPLNGWSIYSFKVKATNSKYYKVMAYKANGDSLRISPGRMIGALTEGRGFNRLKGIHNSRASAEYQERSVTYLHDCVKAYNSSATEKNKIIKLDVQVWKWAYNKQPDNYAGNVYGNFIFDTNTDLIAKQLQVIKQNPTAEAYLNLGNLYYKAALYQDVLKTVQKSLAIKKTAMGFNSQCAAYIQLKEYNLAIKSCKKAIQMDASYQLAKNNLKWAERELAQNKK